VSIKNEPVAIAAALRAVLAAAAGFGFDLTGEQVALLVVAVEAVSNLFVRQAVTPNGLAEYRVSRGGSPTVPLPEPPSHPANDAS